MRLATRLSGLLAPIALAAMLCTPAQAQAVYPDRPISIIVHTKPGGAIDLTARVVAKVARKYIDVPLVVENRYGGSGAVAMRAVLGSEPDGYTMLAAPATFVSTVQITQSDFGMDDFHFLACLTEAPEALITNRTSDVVTFDDIVADAREKSGRQIWVGPGVGSLDHLMAIKTWDKIGITATWVPYDGGAGRTFTSPPCPHVSGCSSTPTCRRFWRWATTSQTRSCGADSPSTRARRPRS
jgi:tripartite-type tricarboxylate transporter receptor subunit TctC